MQIREVVSCELVLGKKDTRITRTTANYTDTLVEMLIIIHSRD